MKKTLEEEYLQSTEYCVEKTKAKISKLFLFFSIITMIVNIIFLSQSIEPNFITMTLFSFLCIIPQGIVSSIIVTFLRVKTYTLLWKIYLLSTTMVSAVLITISLLYKEYELMIILLGSSCLIPIWIFLYLKTAAFEKQILYMCRLIDSENLRSTDK